MGSCGFLLRIPAVQCAMTLDLSSEYLLPGDGRIELRAFTHGAMPRTVPTMMQHFCDDWRARGVDAWNEVPNHWLPGSGERVGWWILPEYLGDRFIAPLIGAPAGTCILQPNVHWIVQCLLSSPETFERRRRLVLPEDSFPSVLHSALRWASILGITVDVVPSARDGLIDRSALLSAAGRDPAVVMISHVGFLSGELLDDDFLISLARKVHEHGGLLAIDGYHATGSVPVCVEDLGADLYFGGLLKEASGSSGNAYVYVRRGLELTPAVGGWFGDADPFGFRTAPAAHPDVRRRFLGGTPAVASMYHAVEGVRVLLAAGIEKVREDSLAKTQRCMERADRAGLAVRSPRMPENRSAMVVLEMEAADRMCDFLKDRGVCTDSRQRRYLRMAPFVWNTTEEIDQALELIGEAAASGLYVEGGLSRGSAGPVS